MKTEMNEDGWSEIVTTNVKIVSIVKFDTREKWIDFNDRNPKLGKTRKNCKCCKKKYTDMDTRFMYLANTDKGNKHLCQDCAEKFVKNGVKYFDNLSYSNEQKN